jgi:hypothetical protein
MSWRSWCVARNKHCSPGVAHCHAGGSPCWDWSSIGNQAGLLGATIAIFWAWCAVVRHEECPLVIHENVCAFPTWLVDSALGGMYTIHEFVICPAEQGFHLVDRKRRYLILTHLTKTRVVHDLHWVYAMISGAMQSHTLNTPARTP